MKWCTLEISRHWLKLVSKDFVFAISIQKLDNLVLPALGATQRWEGLSQPDGDKRTEGFLGISDGDLGGICLGIWMC